MKVLMYILLAAAVLVIGYSAAITVKTLSGLFKGEDNDGDSAQTALKTLRKKLIKSYVISVLLIIATAIVKFNI